MIPPSCRATRWVGLWRPYAWRPAAAPRKKSWPLCSPKTGPCRPSPGRLCPPFACIKAEPWTAGGDGPDVRASADARSDLGSAIMGPVINCAVYEGGLKVRDLDISNPEEMKVTPGRVIWIGLHEPSQELLQQLQQEFKLHELAIEDAYKAHQRPKIEIYGETLFVAMKRSEERR